MLVGTVVLASVMPARGVLHSVAHVATEAAIVLLFFLHEAKLPRQAITDRVRHWRLHPTTLAITFGLFPLIGLGASGSHLLHGSLPIGPLFLSLLPSTVQSSIAFIAMAGSNVAATRSGVFSTCSVFWRRRGSSRC